MVYTTFPFNKIPKGSRIVLYGAGVVGKSYYSQITETGFCDIVLWLDKNADGALQKQPEAIKNLNVNDYDFVIIAIKNETIAFEVKDFLIGYNVPATKILCECHRNNNNVNFFTEFVDTLYKKKCISPKKHCDVLFITPPYWDIYTPFSAVPCLVAELKKNNILACNLDIGIMVFHTAFNKNWYNISRCFYTQSFYKEYVKENYTYPEYLDKIKFLDCKKNTVNDFQRIYSKLDTFQKNILDVLFNMVINENVVYPNLHENHLEYCLDIYDIKILTDTIESFDLTPLLLNIPKVVGFSVTSLGQFTATLALIKIIKAFKNDVKIILGGSCASIITKTNQCLTKQILCDYVDYIVLEEGETAVRMLAEHLLYYKHDVKNIPNLIFLENENLVETSLKLESTNELAVPDYKDIDFSLYLSEKSVLAYQTSRGCFWGHCAFCNHCDMYRHNWRTKDVDKVVNELKMLHTQYNICHFQFVDEAIEPKYFANFVDALSKEGFSKKIKWFYYSRISHLYNDVVVRKAYSVGCRMVMFGVETFSQRVLGHIKKGIAAKNIKDNLELFKRNGIKTFAWLMGVLPGQTKEEILYDMECFKQNAKNIDAAILGRFCLDVNCDMYKTPEKFGIIKTNSLDGYDFDSVNNGTLIEKQDVLAAFDLYRNEVKKYFSIFNRYILFFERSNNEE